MSTNIIHSTTYQYMNPPVTITIVTDNNNEQLSLLIYEADNCIYNQPITIPIYIQQFFKKFSSNIRPMHYVCISRNYFINTLVNYYIYLLVQTSRKENHHITKTTLLYPDWNKIIRYCKVHSPVYYTPALQLIEEALEQNWRSRTILHAILCTSLDI